MKPSQRSQRRRGFTLTEAALVLLVVGTVISAMWVAAEHVWSKNRVYRTTQQIANTVENIRERYGKTLMSWPALTWPSGTDVTSTFDTQGLIPFEMRRDPYAAPGSSAIDHALNDTQTGGSFHVLTITNPMTGQLSAFRIQLLGVGTSSCINLLVSAPLSDSQIGYVQVGTQAMTFSNLINNGNASGTSYAEVLTANTAQTWCNSATNKNEVDFDFLLHS